MGVHGSRKGYGNPEAFFLVEFFFSSSPGTLRAMTVKRYSHFCPREPLHNLVINPVTCISDCDSTSCSRHNLSIWKSCQSQLDNFCVFSVPLRLLFWRVHLAHWTQYLQINLSIYQVRARLVKKAYYHNLSQ